MHNLTEALCYLQNTTPNNDPVYAKVFVNDATGYHAFRNALSRVFALGASRDSLQATCLLEMASKLAVADINLPLADERTAEQKMQKNKSGQYVEVHDVARATDTGARKELASAPRGYRKFRTYKIHTKCWRCGASKSAE